MTTPEKPSLLVEAFRNAQRLIALLTSEGPLAVAAAYEAACNGLAVVLTIFARLVAQGLPKDEVMRAAGEKGSTGRLARALFHLAEEIARASAARYRRDAYLEAASLVAHASAYATSGSASGRPADLNREIAAELAVVADVLHKQAGTATFAPDPLAQLLETLIREGQLLAAEPDQARAAERCSWARQRVMRYMAPRIARGWFYVAHPGSGEALIIQASSLEQACDLAAGRLSANPWEVERRACTWGEVHAAIEPFAAETAMDRRPTAQPSGFPDAEPGQLVTLEGGAFCVVERVVQGRIVFHDGSHLADGWDLTVHVAPAPEAPAVLEAIDAAFNQTAFSRERLPELLHQIAAWSPADRGVAYRWAVLAACFAGRLPAAAAKLAGDLPRWNTPGRCPPHLRHMLVNEQRKAGCGSWWCWCGRRRVAGVFAWDSLVSDRAGIATELDGAVCCTRTADHYSLDEARVLAAATWRELEPAVPALGHPSGALPLSLFGDQGGGLPPVLGDAAAPEAGEEQLQRVTLGLPPVLGDAAASDPREGLERSPIADDRDPGRDTMEDLTAEASIALALAGDGGLPYVDPCAACQAGEHDHCAAPCGCVCTAVEDARVVSERWTAVKRAAGLAIVDPITSTGDDECDDAEGARA